MGFLQWLLRLCLEDNFIFICKKLQVISLKCDFVIPTKEEFH